MTLHCVVKTGNLGKYLREPQIAKKRYLHLLSILRLGVPLTLTGFNSFLVPLVVGLTLRFNLVGIALIVRHPPGLLFHVRLFVFCAYIIFVTLIPLAATLCHFTWVFGVEACPIYHFLLFNTHIFDVHGGCSFCNESNAITITHVLLLQYYSFRMNYLFNNFLHKE
jgi:hypothetical protein